MHSEPSKPLPPGRWESVDPHDLPSSSVLGDEPETKEVVSAGGSVLDDVPTGELDLDMTGEVDFGVDEEASQSSARSAGPSVTTPSVTTPAKPPTSLKQSPATASNGLGSDPLKESDLVDGESDQARIVKRRQSLEHHIRNHPADVDAFRELAAIYRDQNRPVEARRVLKQAMELFPDDPELLWEYEEAVLARSLQQFREVRDLAARLQTPETDRELKRSTQDWARRRIDVCRARLSREPTKVHLNIQLGEAHYDADEFDDAVQVLSRVVDQHEWAPAAYLIIGKCHLALGRDAEAMAALRACALRRAVPAPPRIRKLALQLLVDNSHRLGVPKTSEHYQLALAAVTEDS